jgi:hypothetical protein
MDLSKEIENSSLKEKGPLRVSKWLSLGLFLSPKTCEALWDELMPFFLVHSDRVLHKDFMSDKALFLKNYQLYFQALKEGKIPEESFFRKFFSFSISCDLKHYYKMNLDDSRFLIKAQKPVIQSQFFTLGFSFEEKKIRPMIMGKDVLFWGFQLSFPQLYQSPSSQSIDKISKGPEFPNAELFHRIQRFCRRATRPVFFSYQGEKIVTPFRLGHDGFDWINEHPQLKTLNLTVLPPKNKKEEL